ncbi:TetR/AcrR family transcriptional regulator, partial [Nocardia brasiliensis]|uniref:TetR/AcrR family transcriptional regulator n=1 Tax=Nocardia brasiliensis TaxID=37326 RepID=UPI002456F3D9
MADDNRLQRTYRSPVREDAARRTRDIVVRAAMQVFAERGYAGATIDQIANCAGVSRPTVFAAGNKAQLFALARQYVDNDGDGAEADSTMTQILEIDDPRRVVERLGTHTAAIMRPARAVLGVVEPGAGAAGIPVERGEGHRAVAPEPVDLDGKVSDPVTVPLEFQSRPALVPV